MALPISISLVSNILCPWYNILALEILIRQCFAFIYGELIGKSNSMTLSFLWATYVQHANEYERER